jgi:hypothetical protein
MQGALSNVFRQMIAACYLKGIPISPATRLYVGLCRRGVGQALAGLVVEPDDPAYARVEVSLVDGAFRQVGDGTIENAVPITFSKSTCEWGWMYSAFLADAPTGGTIVAAIEASSVCFVPAGRVVEIPPGKFRLDP